MKKVELLAPAGNLEKLKIAVKYGADAVYLGGKAFGLRAYAGNFSAAEIAEGIQFAHRHNTKVYVTANIFAHNDDLKDLVGYVKELENAGADGLIVSDPGIRLLLNKTGIRMDIHLSTQANTTNWASALFWQEQGIKRIVLARELGLEEIKEVRENVKLELEVFVHGAMCISYSGRCLLSNYMAGRDANRGECAQPCRWNYALVEEKRPGDFYPLEEDERGSYVFNSQDLCLIEHIPELIAAGVDSFKIEGRMKSVHYVATVVSAYRKAIDAYYANPENYLFDPEWYKELTKVSHRDYTTGFLFGKPKSTDHNYLDSSYLRYYDFVGLVKDYDQQTGWAVVEQRNNFQKGDCLEFYGPQTRAFTETIEEMTDEDGLPIKAAPHPQQTVRIRVKKCVRPWDLIRRAKDE